MVVFLLSLLWDMGKLPMATRFSVSARLRPRQTCCVLAGPSLNRDRPRVVSVRWLDIPNGTSVITRCWACHVCALTATLNLPLEVGKAQCFTSGLNLGRKPWKESLGGLYVVAGICPLSYSVAKYCPTRLLTAHFFFYSPPPFNWGRGGTPMEDDINIENSLDPSTR